MKLILYPQKDSKAIRLVLEKKGNGESFEEIALSGEDLVKTLDKILKKTNIELTSLEVITVSPQLWGSITSRRLATVFQQALYIAISTKPKKHRRVIFYSAYYFL